MVIATNGTNCRYHEKYIKIAMIDSPRFKSLAAMQLYFNANAIFCHSSTCKGENKINKPCQTHSVSISYDVIKQTKKKRKKKKTKTANVERH